MNLTCYIQKTKEFVSRLVDAHPSLQAGIENKFLGTGLVSGSGTVNVHSRPEAQLAINAHLQ